MMTITNVALLVGLVGVCLAGNYQMDKKVLVLDKITFDEALEEFDQLMVMFYAPWCPYSKRLLPEFDSAAQQLENRGSNVKLGKVDCTVQKLLEARYGVDSYPTLIFFKSKEATEYTGMRSASDIVEWLLQKSE